DIIIKYFKKHNQNTRYAIINSNNSLTLIIKNINLPNASQFIKKDEITIQIIYRLYTSKSEILHGFDIGSSAVGYDGKYVYFTSLSKFAYEYGCNIVDISRRSTTYEQRLIKYLKRGFKIILPDLCTKII